jgi:hypothetical protein
MANDEFWRRAAAANDRFRRVDLIDKTSRAPRLGLPAPGTQDR